MVQEKDKFAQATTSHDTKRRLTIGFLTHAISDAYGELVWKGVMAATQAAEANLICFPGWAIEDQRPFNVQANVIYDLISSETVDGLVISGTLGNYVGKDRLQQFCERYSPLPMASIAVDLEGIPSVLVANHQGMFDLVTHLIEVHRISHFAFISGPAGNPEAVLRYQGFVDALENHKLPLHPHLVSPPTDWDEASGMKAMKVLMDERGLVPGRDFQAVVTSSDNAAYGALAMLEERGIAVPADVILTGFDAQERSKYLTPSLTTVRQPVYEQAYQAAGMVLSQIQSRKTSAKVELPTELIIRESCGCQNEEITRAKAVTTGKLGDRPKLALAVGRETVLSKMAPVIANFSKDMDQEQAKHLVQAFYTEIRGEAKGSFLNILGNVFKRAELVSEDVFAWQEVISILRQETLPLITDQETLFHASDRCHQALLMIGERAQRIQGFRRIQVEERQTTLDGINRGLLTTSEEKHLITILVKGLPRLEIPSCYVSRYENPVVPTNGCHLILAYREDSIKLEADRFSSKELVPADLLPTDRSYSLIVEPLYLRQNQIGLAVFEAGPKEGIVYETLRGQLSGALWAARLSEYLRSLNEASGEIMSLREPKEILQAVVERACQAAGAKGANVVILDKDGRQRRLAIGGNLSSSKHSSILMGTTGMVSQVMQANWPTLIEDLRKQASPAIQEVVTQGIEAAGCFPLRLRGRPIGAMWVYYEKPHHFSHAEVNALQLYVNQAAIAYDNAKRAKELEHLRQAAEKLASAADVQTILPQMVRSAREVLEADSAVIWSYDMAREAFLPNELAADGVDPEILEKYREDMPRPEGTAAIVIQQKYLAVTDVNDSKYDYLHLPDSRLRQAIGVRSFQGIALQVEKETLGVLYVNHRQPKGFDEEDETTLKTFAYGAALALKKARLLDRLKKGHDTARMVAEASVLENLQGILNAIAKGTQNTLGCDAVSLYTYDEENCEIGFPPAVVGVENMGAVLKFGMVNKDSLIYKTLKQDDLHVAEDAPSDPIVGGPFVSREGIKSSVSIPLQVGNSKVGMMFVNYRSTHHFTREELADIRLFAHQAAVAIYNAQLYNAAKQGTIYLQALYEAGNVVTSTLSLGESLKHIVEQASLLTSAAGGKRAHYCYLVLMENGKLECKATYSSLQPETPIETPYTIDIWHDEKIGIVGRAFKSGESQLVRDVTIDRDYIDDGKTRSELAVPIKIGKDIVGAVVVAHQEFAAFDRNDLQALEALAMQAAIAIENARIYDDLNKHYNNLKQMKGFVGSYTALEWMKMVGTVWGHSIKREVGEALVSAELVRRACQKEDHAKALKELEDLEAIVQGIKEITITAPLSAEDSVSSVAVNQVVRGYLQNQWKHAKYKTVDLKPVFQANLDEQVTVRASAEWLRRGLEIVVENAVQAMLDTDSYPKRLTVLTQLINDRVKITIIDTGPGIPAGLLEQIKKGKPIEKEKGSKGAGVGLALARTIFGAYQGDITIQETSSSGTTVVITLPVES